MYDVSLTSSRQARRPCVDLGDVSTQHTAVFLNIHWLKHVLLGDGDDTLIGL